MSNEQHKARLKHAAEALGWLADGKQIQWHDAGVLWRDSEAPGDSVAEMILDCGWTYRVKPEVAEYESTVRHLATQLVVFAEDGLKLGDRVRVTKIED